MDFRPAKTQPVHSGTQFQRATLQTKLLIFSMFFNKSKLRENGCDVYNIG